MASTTSRTSTTRWAAVAVAAGLALAGCSAGSEDDSSGAAGEATSSSAASSASGSRAGDAAAAKDRSGGSGGATGSTTVAPESSRRLARSAAVSLEVDDVAQGAAQVRSIARRADGWVSTEELSSRGGTSGADDDGDSSPPRRRPARGPWSEITIEVPVASLDASVEDLAEVGTVLRRSSQTEDLTGRHTDVTSRVRTLRASVERLQGLIEDSDDLDQVVTLEGELTDREAELESMTGQLEDLEHRTAMAPITVSLAEPGQAAAPEEDDTGFGAGLSAGWAAFVTALGVGATVLGALTPFAVTGALLLAPVWLWWRRRATRPGREARPAEPTGGVSA